MDTAYKKLLFHIESATMIKKLEYPLKMYYITIFYSIFLIF